MKRLPAADISIRDENQLGEWFMLIKIFMTIKVVAVILKILLLPFLPPPTVYAFCMLISWWALTMTITYFSRKDLSEMVFSQVE